MSNHDCAKVVVGVDTHRDEHVAVAIDQLGLRLGDRYIATTTEGRALTEQGWLDFSPAMVTPSLRSADQIGPPGAG
jgi:hypothetical protein